VLRVGDWGVEAELRATALPGIEGEGLLCNPALLDCAGQLVALWLLETTGEKLGAFPFAGKEFAVYQPAPAAGARLRCRAAIRRTTFATTAADVDFVAADGTLHASLRGLQQRLVDFPSGFADLLFGRGPLAQSPSVAIGQTADGREFLARDGAIWARAMAHAVLVPEEWREWWDRTALPEALAEDLAWRLNSYRVPYTSVPAGPVDHGGRR